MPKQDHLKQIALYYRLLEKGIPPRPIRLEKPGWAGEGVARSDGNIPQPWHCGPFAEGSQYGLELIYPFDTECHVIGGDDGVRFKGDFSEERVRRVVWPPFRMANPGHYSLATLIDLRVPENYSLRIEPHPRFFNDATGTVPVAVIGNLQTSWWPMFFFVTFKSPLLGQTHIFRRGEPYAQVIVVPQQVSYALKPMSAEQSRERESLAQTMMRNRLRIAQRRWTSCDGLPFDDLYKQLKKVYSKSGSEGVRQFIHLTEPGLDLEGSKIEMTDLCVKEGADS